MHVSAGRHGEESGELDAYVDLVRCEGTMELPIGSVDHFNHIPLAYALHRMEIIFDISLFGILGRAGTGASALLGGHDEYCSGN